MDDLYKKTLGLSDYKYKQNHILSINLSDQIILFNVSNEWKVIPLIVSLSYPIIYDKLDKNIISIIVCPVTFRCSVFNNEYCFEKYNNDIMLLKNKTTGLIEPITQKINIDGKTIFNNSKRFEIKMMTLKNALMMVPDLLILQTNKLIEPVINKKYYTNKLDIFDNKIKSSIHPKTLVYIIKYKSIKSNKNKKIILLGKDNSKNHVSGYDLGKSGIIEYLDKYKYKIIENSGYIYPILWFTQINKNDYKVIKI
jgi:hypothetical protein